MRGRNKLNKRIENIADDKYLNQINNYKKIVKII